MSDGYVEVNFDGLVGPTHNYAGLGAGNIASMEHKSRVSSPRRAALEGLEKMRLLMDLGVMQGVFMPQMRPSLGRLRRLGFVGSDARVVEDAHGHSPELLASVYSASSMWAANACTVSASADTGGNKVHMTVANLISNLHRSVEPPETERMLKAVFSDERHFVVHPALPCAMDAGDEGAANHMRLAPGHGEAGIEVFVYGRDRANPRKYAAEVRFPGRQALLASQSVARLHRLSAQQTVFLKQNQEAIDGGVFHNDVIAMSYLDLLVTHERALENQKKVLEELKETFKRLGAGELTVVEVPEGVMSMEEAVKSYLFNSQIVTDGQGRVVMIVPMEVKGIEAAREALAWILEKAPRIKEVVYVGLTQSMFNGGGPACLRLRVPMSRAEVGRVQQGVILTEGLYGELKRVIEKRYRESLAPGDLADPALLRESREAVDVISEVLGLETIIPQ
jgi:succinylarginine dihydrolase